MPLVMTVDLATGTGFFVLFEPDEILQYAGEAVDWFVYRDVKLDLAQRGVAVYLETAIDGAFLFRLTTGELTEVEQAAVRQTEDHFWLDVKGHELIFASSEATPNREHDPERLIREFGVRVPMEPGRYRVIIHRLVGPHEEDVDALLAQLPSRVPAYVIVLRAFGREGEAPPQLDVLPSLSPFLEEWDDDGDEGDEA